MIAFHMIFTGGWGWNARLLLSIHRLIEGCERYGNISPIIPFVKTEEPPAWVYFHPVSVAVPKSEEEVLAACDDALRLAPTQWPPTLPASKELLGAPEWYPFEHEAWGIGESIRRGFVQHPHWKRNTSLISKVAKSPPVAICVVGDNLSSWQ